MVGLDGGRGAPHRDALDHVRVERALHQEVDASDALGLLLEGLDEEVPDDPALALGIDHAPKLRNEALRGIDAHQPHAEALAKERLHLGPLAQSQEAVVHEDAGELVADGAMHQGRGHRGVDAPGEPADGPPVAHPLADPRGLLLDEGLHRPGAGTAADVVHEVGEHLPAALGVDHLGVELHAPDRPLGMAHGGKGRALARPERHEARRQLQYAVAVAHPDHALRAALEAREERIVAFDLEQRPPVLAVVGLLDQAAQPVDESLQAVADAEHGLSQLGDVRVEIRRPFVQHAGRAAREDDPVGLPGADRVEVDVRGMDLAVDVLLADAARDQLGVLRSVVENENPIALGFGVLRNGSHFGPGSHGLERGRRCWLAGGRLGFYSTDSTSTTPSARRRCSRSSVTSGSPRSPASAT